MFIELMHFHTIQIINRSVSDAHLIHDSRKARILYTRLAPTVLTLFHT